MIRRWHVYHFPLSAMKEANSAGCRVTRPSKHIGPQVIRNATKDCYGLFPKRMLYEAFATLMQACNVDEIMR